MVVPTSRVPTVAYAASAVRPVYPSTRGETGHPRLRIRARPTSVRECELAASAIEAIELVEQPTADGGRIGAAALRRALRG
jgi:hypothetical protein